MSVFIPKGTVYPCKATREYTNVSDGQTLLSMPVYEGDSNLVKDNKLIRDCDIKIVPCKTGDAVIEVTFDVDA